MLLWHRQWLVESCWIVTLLCRNGRDGSDDRLVAGISVADVLGDTLALLGSQNGQHRQDAAQGDRDVVDVVHGANGFTGKWHWDLLV